MLLPETYFLLRRLFRAVFFPVAIFDFKSETYSGVKKGCCLIMVEGTSFPNFTQLRPVAVEIDNSLHNSVSDMRFKSFGMILLSTGFGASLGITQTLFIICAPSILPDSHSFCTRRSEI